MQHSIERRADAAPVAGHWPKVARVVLACHPKPKTKAAKARKRRAAKVDA